jgi:uncharacterized protein (DUF2147 family)
MYAFKPVLGLVMAVAFAANAAAQMTPVGLWKTIDDESKEEKSLVRIVEEGGVISGRIEKLLIPPTNPKGICDKCTDERKDQPLIGLTILRNLKQDAEDKTVWQGGEVLDPNNGKTYRARLQPVEGGKQLQMRGYIGPFYRTQIWTRVE